MSFSGEVKEELIQHYPKARHCELAELSAIVHMSGVFGEDKKGVCVLKVHTENPGVARKCFTLLKKTFNIRTDIVVRRNTSKESSSYFLYAKGEELLAIRDTIVHAVCCKRAYIRGAFIASGSMSDPSKSYHFEIVCTESRQAEYLRDMINSFEMDAKIVGRKKSYVVYLKEGSQIVDILNVMEAHVALMELENVRIMKEMRNSVNRKVNCETANINKTVSAAVRQMEDIIYIRDTIGFDKLPEGLKDVALTRLAYPEAALKELGQLMEHPLGKSGVNHRLRKLSEIAEKLRDQ
ncbi:MAG: DNA-binding protein WhiA [Lachnospiraceae bacterium]|uniref:DNA-binding protein WhiA n=1 Tax=Dorea sp. YH-dor226 TaxID=3151119 RepID=UPI001B51166E|nr:DNA-binding protein WhiA [Lachnospiraceae bacterium]MCI6059773.1 DNA-binding protein WhiA [Dorea sp.]